MLTNLIPTSVKKRYLRHNLNKFKQVESKRGYLTTSELSARNNLRDKLYLLTYGG